MYEISIFLGANMRYKITFDNFPPLATELRQKVP